MPPLFLSNSDMIDRLISGDSGIPPVTVTCIKCCTSGSLTASLTDDGMMDPTYRIDMSDISAYVELEVIANGDSTFSLPLLPSQTNFVSTVVLGVDASLGFSIDLVFKVAAGLDIHGGFAIDFPQGAFFEASVLDGAVTDMSLCVQSPSQ